MNLFTYVDTHEILLEATHSLVQSSLIAIDTEFRREDTYYPELGLIQIAIENHIYLIDAVVLKDSLPQFLDTLLSSNSVKLLHAGQQDLEIFNHIRNINLPIPNLFDTQVAALFAGYGESISLESLILKTIGIHIDKTHRTTNWINRPLSDEQKEYALTDVRYLPQIYKVLVEQLSQADRLEWVLEEMQTYEEGSLNALHSTDQWKKIQGSSQSKSHLWLLKEIWLWRERTAKMLNTPRSWLLSEPHIKNIIKKKPKDLAILYKISPSLTKYELNAEELLQIIQGPIAPAEDDSSIKPPPLSKKELLMFDMLSILLSYVADRLNINSKLIAKKNEITLFLREEVIPSKGWRYKAFWSLAKRMMLGQLHLFVSENQVNVVEMQHPQE
jgi:ribonuclease D